jgi:hypothetical protein
MAGDFAKEPYSFYSSKTLDLDGTNQQWQFAQNSDGTFRIISAYSNLDCDISASNQENGTALIRYPWNGGSNQKWVLVNVQTPGLTRPKEVPAVLWSYMVDAAARLSIPADFAWYLAAVCKHKSNFGTGISGSCPSVGDGLLPHVWWESSMT